MTTKKAAATAEATAATVDANASVEPTYKLSALQKHCRKLFGVSAATFVGATTGIADKEYSVNELKSIIEKWCRQEVK